MSYTIESPDIFKLKIDHKNQIAKSGKVPGPGNIHTEQVRMFNDENIDKLTKLFNEIYCYIP